MFTGSARDLADFVASLGGVGYAGVRLRPGVVTDDLPRIVEDVIPELRHRDLLAIQEDSVSLRKRLGLPTVPNRYAAASHRHASALAR